MINNPAPSALRALAYLVEASYGLLFTMIFVFIIVSQPTLASASFYFFMFLILYFLNPLVVYNTVIITHYFGGSIGKLFTGLRVVDEKGMRLSFKRIVFRQTIGYTFSTILFGLGFAAIIKDPKKQGWHDKTVGSQVIVKQNLWLLGLFVCLAALAGSIYLGVLSWEKVTKGPLNGEVKVLIKQANEELKKKDTPKSKALPSITPVPTY